MTQEKQLDEKIAVGGGATGDSHGADPVDKKATLPASHLGNGEAMNKVASTTPGQGEEETDTTNNTKPTGDKAASNKASVATKPSAASASMKEDMDAMFNGEELTEGFKEKAAVIFEAAVTARVEAISVDLEEQYNNALAEELASYKEELTEQVNQYMDYVATQFMEQNKVAVEHSLRTEITEELVAKLKQVFEESNISLPAEKFDLVDSLQSQVAEAQEALNAAIEENASLKSTVAESQRKEILSQVSEGLAATQAEKLAALAEGVTFEDAASYTKKLTIVKENYFPNEKPAATTGLEEINEEVEQPAKTTANSPVSFYAQAISRTVKK